MRLAVLGLRGFPQVMGGVETHCQEIYPRLVELGFNVTVYGRKPYIPDQPYDYKGVRLEPLWAPKRKHLEAIFHTTYGVLQVALNRSRYDLLHLHCIGPALLTPLARLLGLKVVVTTQGPDYDRQKVGVGTDQLVVMEGPDNGQLPLLGLDDDRRGEMGVDVLEMNQIRPEAIDHPTELLPGLPGVDRSAGHLEHPTRGLPLIELLEIDVADEKIGVGIGQGLFILHGKEADLVAGLAEQIGQIEGVGRITPAPVVAGVDQQDFHISS